MTAKEILIASLDYQRLLETAGLPIPHVAVGLLNGLTEYLCVKAQAEDGLDKKTTPPPDRSGA